MAEVAVIGGGLMGHGIALVMALAGHGVRVTDTAPETRARVHGLMASALETLVEAGAAPPGWDADRLARTVRVEAALEPTVEGADLVVEAITENPEAKRAVFTALDRACGADAVIASNTSYLDPFPLIPDARQARALAMHWYTPPYIIDLVDVVPGPATDPGVVEAMRDFVVGLGQHPIVLRKFVPGYVANRIQSAISAEVFRLLDEGVASAREIDDAVIHGLSLRIPILGHLAKADFTGLDLTRRALANASYAPPPARAQSETLDALCAAGRTGVMAGAGYFDWGGRAPEDLFRERDRKLLALKAAMAGIGRMEGA